MKFHILVEDLSGKAALKILMPKVISNRSHEVCIRNYSGIGHVPKNLTSSKDIKSTMLLNDLPRYLKAHGKNYEGNENNYPVIVVCDLDDKEPQKFKQQLLDALNKCNPKPNAHFYFAIEEGEAWLLGDVAAIKTAYPNARESILKGYTNDSICGTWECLAEAVYKGGVDKLKEEGHQAVGIEKSKWAEKITPHMDVEKNASPSFQYFRDNMRELARPLHTSGD